MTPRPRQSQCLPPDEAGQSGDSTRHQLAHIAGASRP